MCETNKTHSISSELNQNYALKYAVYPANIFDICLHRFSSSMLVLLLPLPLVARLDLNMTSMLHGRRKQLIEIHSNMQKPKSKYTQSRYNKVWRRHLHAYGYLSLIYIWLYKLTLFLFLSVPIFSHEFLDVYVLKWNSVKYLLQLPVELCILDYYIDDGKLEKQTNLIHY